MKKKLSRKKTTGILFSQLSLITEDVPNLVHEMEFVGPIKRGDIYSHYQNGHRLFLIADGEFNQSLAVSPGEILDVIRGGALVFGSSSIGALRAAELRQFGMIGVGKIYEFINSNDGFSDDWLGHLYDPDTKINFTIPFIELLFVLEREIKYPLFSFGQQIARKFNIKYDSLDPKTCRDIIKKLNLENSREQFCLEVINGLFNRKIMSQKKCDVIEMLKISKIHLRNVFEVNQRIN